jgi:hypothetical protein
MQFLASLFVAKPQIIGLVALAFVAGYLALRFMAPGIARRPASLLIASTAWGVYAAWEWLVLIKTPEANIRVDLLLLWPVLAILTVWALYRAFR